MDRATIKAAARQQLGGGIFQGNWVMAIVMIIVASAVLGVGSMIPVIGSLLLAGPVEYGLAFLFLKQSRDGEKMEFGDLFKGFTTDFVGNFVLGFMEALFICLWCLLFYIPGIVKAYSYSMCFYIKADHPEYGWKECIDASKEMMNGHKMELFIQDLSFIGWAIVGSLACGIGSLWVSAYISAARAQFYKALVGEV